mgnify:CR=1 FL=1
MLTQRFNLKIPEEKTYQKMDNQGVDALFYKNGASICMTLLHCFFSVVNYGLRMGGGIGEAESPTTYDEWNRIRLSTTIKNA